HRHVPSAAGSDAGLGGRRRPLPPHPVGDAYARLHAGGPAAPAPLRPAPGAQHRPGPPGDAPHPGRARLPPSGPDVPGPVRKGAGSVSPPLPEGSPGRPGALYPPRPGAHRLGRDARPPSPDRAVPFGGPGPDPGGRRTPPAGVRPRSGGILASRVRLLPEPRPVSPRPGNPLHL